MDPDRASAWRGAGPVPEKRGRVGFVTGELNAHRGDRALVEAVFEALPGKVCCRGVVVLPSGVLGEGIPGCGLIRFGLLQAQKRDPAVVLRGTVLAEITEQDTGVRQDVAVHADQLARLP